MLAPKESVTRKVRVIPVAVLALEVMVTVRAPAATKPEGLIATLAVGIVVVSDEVTRVKDKLPTPPEVVVVGAAEDEVYRFCVPIAVMTGAATTVTTSVVEAVAAMEFVTTKVKVVVPAERPPGMVIVRVPAAPEAKLMPMDAAVKTAGLLDVVQARLRGAFTPPTVVVVV